MNRLHSFVLLLLFSGVIMAQQGKVVWKAELQDDVKKISPLQNGKYTFFSADEYAWVFENSTGKKIWEVEIDDYAETAIHQIVNDSLYLVANEDTLICFQILTDSLLWKKKYTNISQDDFTGMKHVDSIAVLSFKKIDLGINLWTGTELWRTSLEYQTSLAEQGTVNEVVFPAVKKYAVFTDNDECVLVSMETGKKLLTLPSSEPNGDLIKQRRAWHSVSSDGRFATFMFEKNFAVIDVDSNVVVASVPVGLPEQFNVLMQTSVGAAVVGEEKIVHIHYGTGKVSQIPADVDDLRNVFVTRTDSADIMIVGMKDLLIGWDIGSGKKAWQTALKFQPGNGFIHRHLANDSNNVIITYLDPSDDLKLYLLSVDAVTGKINYRTIVAHADESLPKQVMPLPVLSGAMDSSSTSFGMDNVGFEYQTSINGGFATFIIRTASEMLVPNTEKQGGEGFVLVDLETGDVVSKNYLKIAEDLSFDGGLSAIAPTKIVGNIILLPGNKNLIALDAAQGGLKWMLIEQDVEESYIFDMAMIDTILYVRTGGLEQKFVYDEKRDKISVEKVWEENSYALLAVDTSSGKVLWKKKFDTDPGRIFHDYSLSKHSSGDSLIFFGDEQFLSAVSLNPASNGAVRWSFEFSDSGTGAMDYSDLFQQSTHWLGEEQLGYDSSEVTSDRLIPLKTSVAVGESLRTSISKILHVAFSRPYDRIVVVGEDGIAGVEPSTGKRVWFHEWDYSKKAIYHRPMILGHSLFYHVDGVAVILNLSDGKVISTTKLDKKNSLFIMPDRSSVIAVDKDEVTGVVIP